MSDNILKRFQKALTLGEFTTSPSSPFKKGAAKDNLIKENLIKGEADKEVPAQVDTKVADTISDGNVPQSDEPIKTSSSNKDAAEGEHPVETGTSQDTTTKAGDDVVLRFGEELLEIHNGYCSDLENVTDDMHEEVQAVVEALIDKLDKTNRENEEPDSEELGKDAAAVRLLARDFNLREPQAQLKSFLKRCKSPIEVRIWHNKYLDYVQPAKEPVHFEQDDDSDQDAPALASGGNDHFQQQNDADPPFDLTTFPHDATKIWSGPAAQVAHILTKPASDETMLPSKKGRDPGGPTVYFRITGGQQEPAIVVSIAIEKSGQLADYKPQHVATLKILKQDIQYIRLREARSKEGLGFVAEFQTLGGIGWGFDHREKYFQAETTEILTRLRSIRKSVIRSSSNPQPKALRLLVEADQTKEYFEKLMTAFSIYLAAPATPWPAYLHSTALTPAVQYGQFIKRSDVPSRWKVVHAGRPYQLLPMNTTAWSEPDPIDEDNAQTVSGVPEISAVNGFYSVAEGIIKLIYGAVIEEKIAGQKIQALESSPASVAFTAAGNVVKGHVRLELTEEAKELKARISDSQYIKLQVDAQGFKKSQILTGSAIPHSLGPAHGTILLMMFGNSRKWFEKWSLLSDDSNNTEPVFLPDVKMSIIGGDQGLKRSVSAMKEMLDNPAAAKFHPLFLNEEPKDLPVTNLLEESGCSVEEVAEVKKDVIRYSNLSPHQKKALEIVSGLRGHCALLTGYPGTGKTLVLATMAILLARLGFHVALAAATNSAVDHLTTTIMEHLDEHNPSELLPVRVYRPMFEKRQLHHQDFHSEESDEPEEPEEPEEVGQEVQMQTIIALQELKESKHKDSMPHTQLSLHARCIKLAQDSEGKDTCMFPYIGDYQTLETPGLEKVDMFQELLRYVKKLEDTEVSYNNWEVIDKKNYSQAFNRVRDSVMRRSKILTATTNGLGGPYIRQYFGSDPDAKIVVLIEESSQDSEVDTWNFLKWQHLGNVKGLILCGDVDQLEPPSFSTKQFPRKNEFGQQIKTSLMSRLIAHRFPDHLLCEQYRMAPAISRLANFRTYNGKMLNHPTTHTLILDKDFAERLRHFLGERNPKKNLALVAVNVTESEEFIADETESRKNDKHIQVGMHFLELLVERGLYKGYTIRILVVYKLAERAWNTAIHELAVKYEIQPGEIAECITGDSCQGRQADYVILDTVVDKSDTWGQIGMIQGERLNNVMNTRARVGMMTLYNGSLLAGAIPLEWKEKHQKPGTKAPPIPYVFWAINQRHDSNYVINVDEEGKLSHHQPKKAEAGWGSSGTWGSSNTSGDVNVAWADNTASTESPDANVPEPDGSNAAVAGENFGPSTGEQDESASKQPDDPSTKESGAAHPTFEDDKQPAVSSAADDSNDAGAGEDVGISTGEQDDSASKQPDDPSTKASGAIDSTVENVEESAASSAGAKGKQPVTWGDEDEGFKDPVNPPNTGPPFLTEWDSTSLPWNAEFDKAPTKVKFLGRKFGPDGLEEIEDGLPGSRNYKDPW